MASDLMTPRSEFGGILRQQETFATDETDDLSTIDAAFWEDFTAGERAGVRGAELAAWPLAPNPLLRNMLCLKSTSIAGERGPDACWRPGTRGSSAFRARP